MQRQCKAAAGFRRVEGFLDRASALFPQMLEQDGQIGDSAAPPQHLRDSGELPAPFVAAMDDDLGTPAAIGVLHDEVRAGNKALGEGEREAAARHARSVRAMLAVLGLDPAHEHWSDDSTDDLSGVVDVLVKSLLEQREAARKAKDFATADAIRDRIKEAGIEVEDTPEGPRWTLAGGS